MDENRANPDTTQHLAIFRQELIDAFDSNVAILDSHGVIIAANTRWLAFMEHNGLAGPGLLSIGESFLEYCDRVALSSTGQSSTVATGVRAVISGASTRFTRQYPFRSSEEEQWFNVSVSPLNSSGPGHVLVCYENVSQITRSEHERERLLSNLTERVKELTAMHAVANALSQPQRQVDEILSDISAILPAAMRFPELARAHVTLGVTADEADHASLDPSIVRATFSDGEGGLGAVEVRYVQQPPTASGDPILPEERTLLESIAGMIGAHMQRQQALVALNRRERHFRSLVQNATDIVFVITAAGVISYASPSFESILGYDPDSLIGTIAFALLHTDDVAPAQTALQHLLDNPSLTETRTVRFRHLDGSQRWLEASGRNLLDDPDVLGVVINARDITDRKEHEGRQHILANISNVLTESLDLETTLQQFARHLIPHIADWCTVNIIDEHGVVQRVAIAHVDRSMDPVIAELAGYQLDLRSQHGMAHTIRTGQTVVYPTIPDTFWNAPFNPEYVRLHQVLGLHSTLSVPMVARGRILGAIGLAYGHSGRSYSDRDVEFVEDIARRAAIAIDNARLYRASREAESSYRILVEQIPAVMYRAPVDSIGELYLSPQIESLLGYTAEEWKSSATQRLDSIHPDDRESFATEMARSSDELIRSDIEYRYLHRNGSVVWVRNTAHVVRDETGTPLFWQGFMSDITARKEAEFALIETLGFRQALIEASPLAIISIGLDQRIISWNRSAEALFGWTEQEVIGRFNPLIPPADVDDFVESHAAQISTAGVVHRERKRLTKDGRLLDASIDSAPLLRADGSVYGTVALIADITERKQSEERIRFQARLLDTVEQAVIATDVHGRVLFWNRFAEQLYGWSAADAHGRQIYDLTVPEQSQAEAHDLMHRLSAGESWSGQFLAHNRSGRAFWAHVTNTPILDEGGGVAGIIGVSVDITEQRAAEAALRESEARFRSAFDDASVGMAIFALDRTIVSVNPALCQMLGYEAAEIVGRTGMDFSFPEDGDVIAPALQTVRDGDRASFEVEKRYRHRNGAAIWCIVSSTVVRNEAGQSLYMVTQFQNITERKSLEQRLLHQTLHDSLTGLPNRTLLMDRLDRATASARRHGSTIAVLFVDLDNFKLINDSLGHAVGDTVLVSIAERLRECVREEDTIARFGGDEFVIMLGYIGGASEAIDVAERILIAMREPIRVHNRAIVMSPSIGIALSVDGQQSREELLRQADIAMYRAKVNGKSSFNLFDDGMQGEALKRLELEHDLRRALERREFRLDFQPLFSIATGKVTGMEALVRWDHPEHGPVGPAQFIPVAEETGLIVPLGDWILNEACQQAMTWQRFDAHGHVLQVGVNISARQFRQTGLVQQIEAALIASGLPAEQLVLELTESVLMDHAGEAVARLQQLAALGLRIAIDDFGTGYSSLAYLKRFPVSILKIDRSFVSGIGQDAESAAIVSATVGLAHNLGMTIVGEGVETVEQLTTLRELGCDSGQGFYFSHPIPASQIIDFLAAQS